MTLDAHTVAARASDDGEWIERVSRQIAALLHSDPARLSRHPELLSATSAMAADHIRAFLMGLQTGRALIDPTAGDRPRAYAQRLIERRVDSDGLAEAYRSGIAAFWDAWEARLKAELGSSPAIVDALAQSTRLLLAWSHRVAARATVVFAEQRAALGRDPQVLRTRTIERILSGELMDPEHAEGRLRYRLQRPQACAVLWTENDQADLSPLDVIRTSSTLFPQGTETGHLELPLGPMVAMWWSPRSGEELPLHTGSSHFAATGGVYSGITGFRRAYEEAMHARRVAISIGASAGTVTRYDDVALRSLASVDAAQARHFVESRLGRLMEPEHRDLVEALRAFHSAGANVRAAARELDLHHNTIFNRLRRAREVLPAAADAYSAEVFVALELLEMVRRLD